MHAACTAYAIDRPLNIVVTLNYWQLGFGLEEAVIAFEKMRNQNFDSWSRYKVRDALVSINLIEPFCECISFYALKDELC